jgi:hypothetical protein
MTKTFGHEKKVVGPVYVEKRASFIHELFIYIILDGSFLAV